jgi:hypothetical protein
MVLDNHAPRRKQVIKSITQSSYWGDYPDYCIEECGHGDMEMFSNNNYELMSRWTTGAPLETCLNESERNACAVNPDQSRMNSNLDLQFDATLGGLTQSPRHNRREIYYDPNEPMKQTGLHVYAKINGHSEHLHVTRQATANITTIRGVILYQTVAHFLTMEQVSCKEALGSEGKAQESETDSHVDDGSSLEILGHVLCYSNNKDWALIEITNEPAQRHLKYRISDHELDGTVENGRAEQLEKRVSVVAKTALGEAQGTLYTTPTYTSVPGSSSFEKVYQATFTGTVRMGDSGTMVVDTKTKAVYGYIMAGSAHTGKTYVIPARNVHRDMEYRLESKILDIRSYMRAMLDQRNRPADLSQPCTNIALPPPSYHDAVYTGYDAAFTRPRIPTDNVPFLQFKEAQASAHACDIDRFLDDEDTHLPESVSNIIRHAMEPRNPIQHSSGTDQASETSSRRAWLEDQLRFSSSPRPYDGSRVSKALAGDELLEALRKPVGTS